MACTLAPAAGAAAKNQVITISPVVVERTLRPGAQAVVQVEVVNQTERPFSFTTGFEGFEASDDPDDDKQFVAEAAATSAVEWMQVTPAVFSLAAGAARDLNVAIQAPNDASPGGHYVSLYVASEAADEPGEISLETRVSVLFLLTVAGDLRHDTRVRIERGSSFVVGAPTRWTVRLDNRGNVHERFVGRVVVDSLWGKPKERRIGPATVLPGGVRRFSVSVASPALPDLHSARFVVDRTAAGWKKSSNREAAVRLPLWALVALGAGVLVAVGAFRRRRDNRLGRAEYEQDDLFGDRYD